MAMTDEEAVAEMTKINEGLVKIGNETDSLVKANTELQAALDEALAGDGMISERLTKAIKATGVRVDSIDQKVTDVRPPEKSEFNTTTVETPRKCNENR
jgi:hypothetical protein